MQPSAVPPAALPAASSSGSGLRVDALDFVRGVCALAVATYHVLGWLSFGNLRALGTYGVYAFFVISGASLAIGYAHRLATVVELQRFLAARYARLVPLFALVLLYEFVEKRPLADLDLALLNLSFLFGLANPGETSLVTGGWSLGIGFVFYLMFPLVMASLAAQRTRWFVLIFSLIAQRIFVDRTLGIGGVTALAAVWITYTQPLAFIAYFVWGCWLGRVRLAHPEPATTRASLAWSAASVTLLALVFVLPNASDREALVGVKGTLLCCATIASVACASRVSLNGVARGAARFLGDVSYGVYLLHPVAFAVLCRVVPMNVLARQPLGWTAVTVGAAVASAYLVKRWFEDPITRLARARIARIGHR